MMPAFRGGTGESGDRQALRDGIGNPCQGTLERPPEIEIFRALFLVPELANRFLADRLGIGAADLAQAESGETATRWIVVLADGLQEP